MDAYFVDASGGEAAELGVARMRLVVPQEETGGAFALTEFRGGEGAWTVPHLHQQMEESFYVLEGSFVFTVGGREITAGPHEFILVPRGTPHVLRAENGGGAFLCMFSPGGLERMFLELGRLPGSSITDPAVRAAIAKRYDSIPTSIPVS